VVVVSINYRLGAFGFTGRSNAGLRDMVLALEWVRRHIASFGGDPGDVTVFGESAGGSAVIALMGVPAAAGLFHRVFAMSPSINQLRSGVRADETLERFLAEAGAESLDELRGAPVQRILEAQSTLLADMTGGYTWFTPTVDGDLVPGSFVDAAAASPIPLVLGTTRDENQLFTAFNPATAAMTEADLARHAARLFGDAAEHAVAAYRDHRAGATPGQLASAISTDETFRVPARRLAEDRVGAGHPTWMYWFTWATPAFGGVLGSCHAVDIPFVFHNLDRPGVAGFTGESPERVAVADAASAAVLALAHRGEPGWPAYDLDRRATQRLDVVPELLDDPERELRVLW
jgi:para-nitrobenzyl esterase